MTEYDAMFETAKGLKHKAIREFARRLAEITPKRTEQIIEGITKGYHPHNVFGIEAVRLAEIASDLIALVDKLEVLTGRQPSPEKDQLNKSTPKGNMG